MVALVVDEVALARQACHGVLPFRLRGQALAGPTRVGVRFVVGDVHHGLVRVDLAHT